jgi:hypothetical protein
MSEKSSSNYFVCDPNLSRGHLVVRNQRVLIPAAAGVQGGLEGTGSIDGPGYHQLHHL